jgi:hypothetical protein
MLLPWVRGIRTLFEGYDEEFRGALASLKGKLEGEVRTLSGGQSAFYRMK